ncbi:hypothetical protein H9P43_000844 [Blastocladiella emersonii ATCC 22665]|nr:hypothetical protein H9P43_000844 [Blastocladiella emersonii ATCC 22665]
MDYAIQNGTKKLPLIFSDMKPVAEDTVVDTHDMTMATNVHLEGVGQIKKQKKAAHITHTTGFGAPIGQYQPSSVKFVKEQLVHVFYFAYMNRNMLEVRNYIPTPDTTATALGVPPPASATASAQAIKLERGTTEIKGLIKLGDGSSAHKRRRTNEGPVRPTPVVYLDDGDD